jgi:hypothetical protein
MKRSNPKSTRTAITIKLRCAGDTKDVPAEILGAFSDGPRVVLLCRITDSKLQQHGICLLLVPSRACHLAICPEDCDLPIEDWPRFLSLPVNAIFRLGSQPWAKQPLADIRKLVGRKRFTCSRDLANKTKADDGKVLRETSNWHEGAKPKMRVQLPAFAQKLLRTQKCPFCRVPYTLFGVSAAGVRRQKQDQRTYFFYEAECAKCGNPTVTVMTSRPCSMRDLRQILAAMFDEQENI